MRKFLYLLLIPAFLACKEEDKTEDNPSPDPNNITIGASFVYGEEGIRKDSLLTNDLGYNFFIDEIKMVFSDYWLQSYGDTIFKDSTAFVISMEEPEQKLMELKPGGYSGYYGLRLGLDSLHNALIERSDYSEDSDMNDADLYRNGPLGIDHVIIRGRLLDPFDPLDTLGKIPLEYRIGTYLTSRKFKSEQKNFSIERTNKVRFILYVDLKPMLHQFELLNRPKVTTDINNSIDLLFAKQMSDSLKVGLF